MSFLLILEDFDNNSYVFDRIYWRSSLSLLFCGSYGFIYDSLAAMLTLIIIVIIIIIIIIVFYSSINLYILLAHITFHFWFLLIYMCLFLYKCMLDVCKWLKELEEGIKLLL